MGRYLARRLALMVPTFLGITMLTFAVARLAPGDPFALDPSGPVVDRSAARQKVGLDAPLPLQYARWLGRVVRLDFGRSLVDQRPVGARLREALPGTALVAGGAWLLAHLLAVPLGVLLAVRRRRLARLASASLALLAAVPTSFVALLLLMGLATRHRLFPLQGLGDGGVDTVWHLVLPVTCLMLPTLAVAARQVRQAMLAALGSDHVLAARARGVPERRIVWHHALRNSLLPLVTLAGASLPHVLSGSVIVERIFGIPGMGLLAFEAIGTRDYPLVMGAASVVALATLLSMLAVDLSYGLLDPRVRVESAA